MVVNGDFHGLSPDAQLRNCGSDDQAAAAPPTSLTNSRRLIKRAPPGGACEATARLLPRFETALRACARLVHDLVRVDRAPQLGDAFDARARGSLAPPLGSVRFTRAPTKSASGRSLLPDRDKGINGASR